MFSSKTKLTAEKMGTLSAIDRVVDYLVPSGLPAEIKAKRILICFLVVIAVPVLWAFSVILFCNQFYLVGFFLLSAGLLMLSSILICRHKKNVTNYYRANISYIGYIFLYYVGTSELYPSRLLWTFMFPLGSFYLLGRKEGLLFNGVYFIGATILISYQNFPMMFEHFYNGYKLEYISSLLVITLISYSFEAIRERYEKGMKARQLSLEQEIDHRKRMEYATQKALKEQKQTQAQLIQSSKLASIGELASGVAHELNQPLMVIRTMSLVLTHAGQNNSLTQDKIIEHLQLVDKNTKRMMNIIRHLSDFSRQGEGKFEPVMVNHAIKGCFLMLGEQLQMKNIKAELDLAEPLPAIMGNVNQLEQVFLNIIVNARDAIEAARLNENTGGLIEVVTRVNTSALPGVEILITDNGQGISADLDKIFDPFFTTKEIGKGTGLGLSISYGIIKAHKGEIEVRESSPDGTTFRILFPAIMP